jgi:uncharacterized protein (DUF58 family)
MPRRTNLLSPQTIAKIASAVLRARHLAEGTLSGIHKSPHKGSSIEFLEHKRYSPGDDLKNLDWKLLARSDRYYVKEFEDETNLRAVLVVDASASMGYGPDGDVKIDTACMTAAAMTYLLLSQSDAVGMLSQDGPERVFVPPRAAWGHFRALAARLGELRPAGKAHWLEHLTHLAGSFHKRGMFIIISDLFVARDPMVRALRLLRERRHDVLLFHVLHPWELEFPFREPLLFVDIEAPDRRLFADPRSCRDRYLEELRSMCEFYRQQAALLACDYHLLRTDAPLEDALVHYLAQREARLE